ncbi:MAG: carboxypeptidase-like regulatory domain-containing protein, partial [Bacteroidia bacterium]
MKTIRANLFLLILMMLVLPNCKDKEAVTTDRLDSSKTNNTDKYDPSKLNIDIGQSTTVSVAGLVLDEKGNPISGAEVILFSDVTMTDDDGKFVFFEKGAYSNHAYVKVIKEGYLVGSRAFIPIPGMNNVVIKMLSAKTVGSFDSNAGGDAFFKGVSIKFKSGFITSSGSKYNGKVTVKARYLDPTAED